MGSTLGYFMNVISHYSYNEHILLKNHAYEVNVDILYHIYASTLNPKYSVNEYLVEYILKSE